METLSLVPAPLFDGTSAEPEALARQLAAMGHPVRLRILRHLACEQGRCCKDVVGALPLAQSTVSQHLKVLVESGLVTMTQEGKRTRYALNCSALAEMGSTVSAMVQCCTRNAADAASP